MSKPGICFWLSRKAGTLGTVVPLLILAGCGGGLPKNFGASIEQAPWFAAPLEVQLPVDRNAYMPVGGASFGNVPGGCVAAKLVEKGLLQFLPDKSGAPWWTLSMNGGGYNGAAVSAPLGRRSITGHANDQHWKDGPLKYFATTVSYKILSSGMLPGPKETGPFTFRAVFVFDPKVGSWAVSDESRAGINEDAERAAVLAPIMKTGACELTPQSRARDAAQAQTFNLIEADLAQQGAVERGSSPHVLASRNAGLAYYLGLGAIQLPPTSSPTETPSVAARTCQQLKVKGYSGWRLPTMNEVVLVTKGWRMGGNNHEFVDVPDSRLWREFPPPPQGQKIAIVTNDPGSPSWSPYGVIQGIVYFPDGQLSTGINTLMPMQPEPFIYKQLCVAPLAKQP